MLQFSSNTSLDFSDVLLSMENVLFPLSVTFLK